MLKNVDAIRAWKPGRLVLFESNAFGEGPYGGQITVARVDGTKLGLQTVVTGLNDPSSGAVWGDRVYFIESKYALLTKREGRRRARADRRALRHPVACAAAAVSAFRI